MLLWLLLFSASFFNLPLLSATGGTRSLCVCPTHQDHNMHAVYNWTKSATHTHTHVPHLDLERKKKEEEKTIVKLIELFIEESCCDCAIVSYIFFVIIITIFCSMRYLILIRATGIFERIKRENDSWMKLIKKSGHCRNGWLAINDEQL